MSKHSKNLVIVVGPFSFPDGGAAARRVLGNCQSLTNAGFSVLIASGQPRTEISTNKFEDIECVSLGERDAENLPRWLKRLVYFRMGRQTIRWLELLEEKPIAVILYSGYSPYLWRLIPWAKKNEVQLVFDAVEWYDPESFLGWLSPYQINIEFAMRRLLPKVSRIITISGFLLSYYEKFGIQCVVVPPTLDVKNTEFGVIGRVAGEPLKLVYAGSPGKKDLLDNILEAVFRLRSAGYNLHLSVAGIKASEASTYSSVRSRAECDVAAGVDFKGILTHSDSMKLVRNSDFSLLLRADARYSRAGFPTKFVESFAVGTPVIANITSDLATYLLDGVTGIVCEGWNAIDMEAGLLKALKIPESAHSNMRNRCREVAASSFDYRTFSPILSKFLNPGNL